MRVNNGDTLVELSVPENLWDKATRLVDAVIESVIVVVFSAPRTRPVTSHPHGTPSLRTTCRGATGLGHLVYITEIECLFELAVDGLISLLRPFIRGLEFPEARRCAGE